MDNEKNETIEKATDIEEKTETGADAGGVEVEDEKIEKVLKGTLEAKQETVLKSYYKQLGLSKEEVEKAVADYKERHKDDTPDYTKEIEGYKTKIGEYEAKLRAYELSEKARGLCADLGVDGKRVEKFLKYAKEEISTAYDEKGVLDEKKLKTALETVLEDLPEFKAVTSSGRSFSPVKVGAEKQNADQNGKKKGTTARQLVEDIFR